MLFDTRKVNNITVEYIFSPFAGGKLN